MQARKILYVVLVQTPAQHATVEKRKTGMYKRGFQHVRHSPGLGHLMIGPRILSDAERIELDLLEYYGGR